MAAASRPTFRDLWRDQVRAELPEFREILGWCDLFDLWERNGMPESTAAGQLHHGLDLLYGRAPSELASAFLKRCVMVADRASDENKFKIGKWCKASFPANRGSAARVRHYARALLGLSFDTKGHLRAADDIVCYIETAGDWPDSHTQAFWLAAVRMSLVAGDLARALALLDEAKSLKWHQAEADLLADVTRAAVAAGGKPVKDAKLLARFDKLFDKVRSPRWRGRAKVYDEPDEQRLELAAIRHRYFVSKSGAIDWEKVIDSIRR